MNPIEQIRMRVSGARRLPNPREQLETSSTVLSGAYGGVGPRVFPTNVNNIFTKEPRGGQISTGIRQPMAWRPPSAAMLDSADFHSNVSMTGMTKNMPTVPFSRKSVDIVPPAVTDVTHLRDIHHPTVARKVRRGKEAL